MNEPKRMTVEEAIEEARRKGLILREQGVTLPSAGGGQEAALPQISGAANLPAGPPVFERTLPYPPSVNHYLRYGPAISKKTGKQYLAKFMTKKGTAYRLRIKQAIRGAKTLTGPLAIEITTHPPDKIRRDIDNVLKCLLDALQHAGVYEDDNQIARLTIQRGQKATGGSVDVSIRQITPPQPTLW